MDPPRLSLCPGYKHVSAFSPSLSSPKSKNILLAGFEQNVSSPANENGAEEDTDYEEEVEYVVLDLGNIEPTLVPNSSSYRLIGLDTPTPFLQLSGTILRGRHDNLLGSELIFSDDKDSSSTSNGQKNRGVTHVTTTSKRIAFKEVQLRSKENATTPMSAEAITHIGKGSKPEQECLGDTDDKMSIDEDVNLNIGEDIDMKIDPVLREPQRQPQVGPSSSILPSVPPSVSTIPLRSPSRSVDPERALTSFSSFISIVPDAGRPTGSSSSVANAEELSSDLALRIDRLTGISPPLKRTPGALKKTVMTTPFVMGSTTEPATKSKATVKRKQKQKATVDPGADESGMDTSEDS